MVHARSRKGEVKRLLRDLRGGTGLLLLGAGLGASGFLLLDSLRAPAPGAHDAAFSLRGVYYGTCREALQDGRTNIRRSEPGYRPELDADNDGLACEPFRGP